MKKTPLLLLTLIFSLLIVPTTYAASGENVVAEDMMAVTKYRTVEFVVSEPYTATRTVSYVVKEPYVVTEQVKVTRYRDVVRMAEEEYEAYRTVMVPQQYTAYREEEVEEEYTAYRDVTVQEKYTAYRVITIKEPYTQKFFDTTVTSYRYVTKKVPYTAYRTVTKKQPYTATRTVTKRVPYTATRMVAETRAYTATRTVTKRVPYTATRMVAETRAYTATRTVTKRVPYTATRMVAETRPYTATRTVTKRVPYTATRMVAETRPYTATRTVREVFKEPYAVMESIEVTKYREVTKTRTEEYIAYRDVKKTKKEPYVVYEPKLSSIKDSKVDIEEQKEKEVKDREKEVAAVADKKALQAMTEETVEALAKTVTDKSAKALGNIEDLLNEAGATNLGIENDEDIKATSFDTNSQTKQLSKAVVAQIQEQVASDWQKASEDVAKMTKTERKEMLILLRENNNGNSFVENGLSRKKAKPDEWKTTDENTEEFDWHDGYEAAIDEEIANGIDAISQAASSAQTLDDKIAAIKAAYDIVMKEIQAIATAKWEPVYDDYQNSPIIAAAEELYNQQTESQQLILELAIIEADTIYQEAIAPFEELKLIQGSQSTPTQEWQEAVSEFSEEWRAAINAATEIYIVTTVVARTLYEQTIQPVEDEYDSTVDEIFTERRNRELASLDAKNDATHAAIDASLASAEEN